MPLHPLNVLVLLAIGLPSAEPAETAAPDTPAPFTTEDAGAPTPLASEQCTPVYPFVIDRAEESKLPLWDQWQVLRDGVAVSDLQLLQWAGEDERGEELSEELTGRGIWIYAGMGISAAGTAISSVGWLLYGQDNVDQARSLSLGIGGIVVGIAGLLVVSDRLQKPLQPYLAPSPRHRISRREAQDMVYRLNRRHAVCAPVSEDRRPR